MPLHLDYRPKSLDHIYGNNGGNLWLKKVKSLILRKNRENKDQNLEKEIKTQLRLEEEDIADIFISNNHPILIVHLKE